MHFYRIKAKMHTLVYVVIMKLCRTYILTYFEINIIRIISQS